MAHRSPAGERAPANHRVHRWIGAGWWRRLAWVEHAPDWYQISEGPEGLALDACAGDAGCTVTRVRSGRMVLPAWAVSR